MRHLWPVLLWGLLALSCLAQPAPVEIPLVPPPDHYWEKTESVQPDWQAPAILCPLCGENKVDGSCGCQRPLNQDLADLLYHALDTLIATAFSDKLALKRAVGLKVVSGDHLKLLNGEPVLGLYEDGIIYLSGELRRREALAVMAHEYGHAWQYQQRADIDGVEGLLFEGFAEWVSFRVLAQAGDRAGASEVMRDPSVYGRGARWYLSLEKKTDLDAVLECAKHRLRK